jgi:hypothetical protein
VTLPATDSGCLGVSETFYTLDTVANTYTGTAFTVSGDSIHDLSYYSTDGTYDETSQQTTISIDTVVPTLSLTTDRLPDSPNGWWTAPVTMTVTASDATSGVDTLDTNHNSAGWTAYTSPITLSTDGTHTFDARVIDVAGWETVDGLSIPIDTTAPTLQFVFEREADRNVWYNHSVHVGVETSDATSGLSGTVARLTYEGTWRPYQGAYLIGGNGEHLFEAAVTDMAGNVTSRQVTVPVDITPPMTTLTWDGEELCITATDNRSGVMGTTLTINDVVTPYQGEPISFEIAGDYRIEVYSTDMAGNDEAVQVLNISYDPDAVTTGINLTPPTLSGELTCSDNRYDVTGFASAGSDLSSVYLLAQAEGAESFEVSGARYDYNPASSDVEAIAFYYMLDDDLDYSFTLVAEDEAGNERRLDLECTTATALILTGTDMEETNPMPSSDGEPPSSSEYINLYPSSLGDMTADWIVPEEIQFDSVSVNSATTTNNTQALTSNYTAPDTSVTVLEASSPEVTIVSGNPSPLSAQDLATILSLTGLLATTTAAVGLQVSETARRREEELEAERLLAEQQRQADLTAQAQRAKENTDMNEQMRAEAQKEVILEVQQSEANKRYHEHIAALWAEYYAHLDSWQQQQQERAAAATAIYSLEPGSTIADLPQDIQDIYWELGNMSLEYAYHVEKDANGNVMYDESGNPITWVTNDADGQWAFQDQERRNLGYYQYLIREAAASGDMGAIINHATNAATYLNTTLTTRIDRELAYIRDNEVEITRQNQETSYNNYRYGDSRSEFEAQQTQISIDGVSNVINQIDNRASELKVEMIDRGRENLGTFVDLEALRHQSIASSTIIANQNAVMVALNVTVANAPDKQSQPEQQQSGYSDNDRVYLKPLASDMQNENGIQTDIILSNHVSSTEPIFAAPEWTDPVEQSGIGNGWGSLSQISVDARDANSENQLLSQIAYLQMMDVTIETNGQAILPNESYITKQALEKYGEFVDASFETFDQTLDGFASSFPQYTFMSVQHRGEEVDTTIYEDFDEVGLREAGRILFFNRNVGPMTIDLREDGQAHHPSMDFQL